MVQWLRMQVLGMEVPGSNFRKVFSPTFFVHLFTLLLKYLDPVILHLFGYCFITLSL